GGAGPANRNAASFEHRGGDQRLEASDVHPIQSDDQGLFTLFDQFGDDAAQGVGSLDAVVGNETPASFNLMLGRPCHGPADVGQRDPLNAHGGGHQGGEGFGL